MGCGTSNSNSNTKSGQIKRVSTSQQQLPAVDTVPDKQQEQLINQGCSTSNLRNNIFVFGASENVGNKIIHELLSAGMSVTAGVRTLSKPHVQSLKQKGVIIKKIDLSWSYCEISQALKNHCVAVIIPPETINKVQYTCNAINSCKGTQCIKHIVIISQSFPNISEEIEEYLKAPSQPFHFKDISYTIIRVYLFIENLLKYNNNSKCLKDKGEFYGTINGELKYPISSMADVAEVVRIIVQTNQKLQNQTIQISSGNLSNNEIAEYISKKLQKTIKYVQVSSQEQVNQLIIEQDHNKESCKDRLTEIFCMDGVDQFENQLGQNEINMNNDYFKVTGKNPKSTEEWIIDQQLQQTAREGVAILGDIQEYLEIMEETAERLQKLGMINSMVIVDDQGEDDRLTQNESDLDNEVIRSDQGNWKQIQIEQNENLEDILRGFSKVLLLLPQINEKDSRDKTQKILRAAVNAEIEYVVMTQIMLRKEYFTQQDNSIEQEFEQQMKVMLESANINYSIMRFPVLITDLLKLPLKTFNSSKKQDISIKNNRIIWQTTCQFFGGISGDVKIKYACSEDIGQAAAVLMYQYPQHADRTYNIVTGYQDLNSIGDGLSEHIRKCQIGYSNQGKAAFKLELLRIGRTEEYANSVIELMNDAENDITENKQLSNDFERITGYNATSLGMWLERHKELFF